MADLARNLIDDATRQVRNRGIGEVLSAQNATDCLRDLNTLLDSLNLGQWRRSSSLPLTLDDEVDIPRELIQPVTSMLAVKVAGMFGIVPPGQVIADAERGSAQIAAFRLRHGTATIDSALLNMPSQRFSRGN